MLARGSTKSWKFSIHGVRSRVLLGSPVTSNRIQVRDKAEFWVKIFGRHKMPKYIGPKHIQEAGPEAGLKREHLQHNSGKGSWPKAEVKGNSWDHSEGGGPRVRLVTIQAN